MRHYTEGEILKALREKMTPPRGTSQTTIAAELGFSVPYIQAILSGSKPLSDRMAEVLGYRPLPVVYVKKDK
jgi:plasmid maintenance system antidote protein VapI